MNKFSEHPGKFLDVVCNSYVGPDEDKVTYLGKTYYFCCAGCMKIFLDEPEKYINKDDK